MFFIEAQNILEQIHIKNQAFDTYNNKIQAREIYLKKRKDQAKKLHIHQLNQLSAYLLDKINTNFNHQSDINIGIYMPLKDEINCLELINTLQQKTDICFKFYLPCMLGQQLIFKSYQLGDVLQTKAFNVQEPLNTKTSIELEHIHVLILPCVGAYIHVDLNNHQPNLHRIGYGAGFYDKTLANLKHNQKPLCVGIGLNKPCYLQNSDEYANYDSILDAYVYLN